VQQFLLEQKDLPTAFLAGNDLSAIGTVKAIHETKWRVPDDFSVIGFDGIDLLDYFMPRLTTVKNPIQLQGVTAVNHLIEMIEENACGVSYVLPGELSIKQSTKQVNE
jgi:LacI family purine nucleotide synthesis repressor